jgi:hypothetical protein
MVENGIIILIGGGSVSIKIGDVFGKLTVIDVKINPNGGVKCTCHCECGNIRMFDRSALIRGNNKSCGCLSKSHGLTGSRIYLAWGNMKRRCNDPTNKSYANYGGRGISYDKRWERFENFYEDMKDTYADNLTLDRIDVDANYSKENCRWADKKTQANNMTTNHLISFNGETLTIAEMARKYNLDYELFRHRLKMGWTVERAMNPIEQQEEINYNGETKTVSQWAEEIGLTYHQLKKRLMRGWTVERAITQPLKRQPKRK